MPASLFQNRYKLLFIVLLAVYSYINTLFIGGDKLFDLRLPPYSLFLIMLGLILLVWETNRYSWIIFQRSKLPASIHPLILYLGLSIVNVIWISALVSLLVLFAFKGTLTNWLAQLKLALAFTFRVNLFLHSVNAVLFFQVQLRETRLEAEKLRSLTVEARFDALRKQVNPHFLFNSFNVLSSLVYKDAALADRFVQQMAKVYRYLLSHEKKKLVGLPAEIDFIQAYLFLLKIRFGDNLIIHQSLPDDTSKWKIPPGSLQILVENTIKHNVVSRKRPLSVEIYLQNNDYIVVKNNLQKLEQEEHANKVGLQNIIDHYKFITTKQVIIDDSNQSFTVKLPLIEAA